MRATRLLGLLARLAATFLLLCPLMSYAQVANSDARNVREQSIYIPYDKLQETFEKEGRGVFVPYERFQELWKAARAAENRSPETGPPVKSMISEIDSDAVVEQDVVRVNAVCTIDLLGTGWLTIPIRLGDAAILAATVDGETARLVPHVDGQALLIKKASRDPQQVKLNLEYAKGFAKGTGRNFVDFQAPIAPVNRWKIRVPEEGVKISVQPMLATTDVPNSDSSTTANEAGKKETAVLAFVGAASTVKIDWTPKAEGATGLEALVSVRTEQRVVIEEGVTRTHTGLTYEVSRAALASLRIQVPLDQKVVNVIDANVKGWNVVRGEGKQTIKVDLFQPATKQQRLEIELEQFRDPEESESAIQAPVVAALDVGRQRGVVAVQVRSDLRVETTQRDGLSQLGAAEVPASLREEDVEVAYRYAALPFKLGLKVEQLQPRITVDQLVRATLDPRQLSYRLFAKYTIEKAGVFELRCHIPEGMEVRTVRGWKADGMTAADVESFAPDLQDASRLKVNLSSKAEGVVGIELTMHRDLDTPNLLAPTGEAEQLILVPPRVTGEHVVRSTGRVILHAPESLRLTPGQLTGLRSIAINEVYKTIPQSAVPDHVSSLRPALAYEFSGAEVQAEISAERRRPYVTATQVLIARIEPGVVKYEARFDVTVDYSGVDDIRIDVPTEIATGVRNESVGLREQTIDPPPEGLPAGYTAMSFTGDTELLGAMQIQLSWEMPIQNLDVGKSVDVDVPVLIPQGVARSNGQVVLVKAETIDVRPKTVADGLNPIDPQVDLRAGINIPNAAAALEFQAMDWNLTLTATRYQLENLKHTSVEQAVLRMVITRSDRVAVQALYRLRSNMQRLEIELPYDVSEGQIEFDTKPLRINGRAVPLERGDGPRTFFVPLVGHTTNDPMLLEIRYTMPGDGSDLRYPMFPNEPAMQRVNLVAYLPKERDFIGSQGPWAAEMAWQTGPMLERRYHPKQNLSRLVSSLTAGINVMGEPGKDFPVAGTPLLFTTLRPKHPDDGALQLRAMDRQVLDAIVLVGGLSLGVLLLSQTWLTRLIAVTGGTGVGVLLGLFAPTLAGQVLDQTLIVALFLVGLLWAIVSMLQMGRFLRKRRAELALAGAGNVPATASPVRVEAQATHSSEPTAKDEPPEPQSVEQEEGESMSSDDTGEERNDAEEGNDHV